MFSKKRIANQVLNSHTENPANPANRKEKSAVRNPAVVNTAVVYGKSFTTSPKTLMWGNKRDYKNLREYQVLTIDPALLTDDVDLSGYELLPLDDNPIYQQLRKRTFNLDGFINPKVNQLAHLKLLATYVENTLQHKLPFLVPAENTITDNIDEQIRNINKTPSKYVLQLTPNPKDPNNPLVQIMVTRYRAETKSVLEPLGFRQALQLVPYETSKITVTLF